MKRILFCAGVLALAASCTESELDSVAVQNNQSKGITFQAVDGNDAATRGGFVEGETSYVPFWYAEKDKITVWGTKVSGTNGGNRGNDFVETGKATYKATQSAKLGVFTGISDDDVLDFEGAGEKNPSKFFALYPSDLTTTYSTNKFTVDLSGLGLATQTQNDIMGDGIYQKSVKYSVTTAYPTNSYDAVGEKINLNFQRVLSGLIFSTKNADKYTTAKAGEKSLFGNLKTITVTALDKKFEATNASALALGSGAQLEVDVTDIEKPKKTLTNGTSGAKSITLTLGAGSNGLPWSDAANAFVIIAPAEKRTAEEYIVAEYKFANITLNDTLKTSKNFSAGRFYGFKELDINSFNYLVTNESGVGTNDRALVINKGKLSDILAPQEAGIVWNGGNVAFDEFSEIVCNVELTEAELKMLVKFENLKNITWAKNTAIPAETFKGLEANLVSIDMPLVKTIDPKAFNAKLSALETLNLPSYQFENEAVNANILEGAKTRLKVLDMSGVEDMTPTFGIERQIDLSGFAALEEVTVKDGVQLSANAFKDCAALTTVNGTVKLAVSAFNGCVALEAINIEGTVIPESAFNGCVALKSVLVNKAPVVPTAVGASAFEGAKAIVYMDLSKTTELGASAFKESGLISLSKSNNVLTVGATSIPVSAFEGTGVKMVEFTQATSFAVDIFKNCSDLIQVKFHLPFIIQANDQPETKAEWAATFGTAANVNLFVAPGQKYVTDNVLSLPTSKKEGDAKITFKGIYVK